MTCEMLMHNSETNAGDHQLLMSFYIINLASVSRIRLSSL